jgi:hypothetical protein
MKDGSGNVTILLSQIAWTHGVAVHTPSLFGLCGTVIIPDDGVDEPSCAEKPPFLERPDKRETHFRRYGLPYDPRKF